MSCALLVVAQIWVTWSAHFWRLLGRGRADLRRWVSLEAKAKTIQQSTDPWHVHSYILCHTLPCNRVNWGEEIKTDNGTGKPSISTGDRGWEGGGGMGSLWWVDRGKAGLRLTAVLRKQARRTHVLPGTHPPPDLLAGTYFVSASLITLVDFIEWDEI